MKKVLFTSILLLSLVSFGGNVYAQGATGGDKKEATNPSTTQPSVTFKADGNTLTISGQGDLTTLKEVSSELKFTTIGRDKVGTQNNQYNNNPVGASAVYNKNYKYYAYFPKKIVSAYPDYVDATSVTQSWNDDKIGNLYHYDNSKSLWVKVQGTDQIDFNDSWVSGKQYSNYATSEDGSDRILLADFKISDYFMTTLSGVTFKSNKKANLYVITNGSYVKIADDAEYDANEVYYYWDASTYGANVVNFGEISEDQMLMLGYLEHPEESVAEKLHYYLSNNSGFTTIKFVNEGTKQPLKINKEIVNALLYSNNGATVSCNASLTTLDLSAATCEDLSKEAFANSSNASGSLALQSLTLPLTKMTSVCSETEKTNVEKMVLPSEVLDAFRQLKSLKSVTIPEGYHRLDTKAFSGCENVSEFNFPASLKVIGDNAFEGCKALKELKLVEGLENIGKQAFYTTGVSSVTFPSTLKIINDGAFMELSNLKDIKFNEGLKFIGNSAFFLSSAILQTTLEIPVSVRYMGPFAFNNREYQDVFFYGEKAPLMPLGDSPYSQQCKNGTAFSANILMGNNGFNDGNTRKADDLMDDARHDGYANRENYKNNGYYFVILHFPKGLDDAAKAKYTDITRRYETIQTDAGKFPFGKTEGVSSTYAEVGKEEKTFKWEGNPELVAAKNVCFGYQDTYLGKQYVWPSQEQWTRSFVVNSNGYNWDGITKYPSDEEIQNGYLSEDDIATLEYAGYKIGDGEGEYTKERLASIAHMGTRQFVLANADVNKDEDEEKVPEYPISLTTGQWWTLCVPFNMTKKQVLETFGEDTQLCLFSEVERHTGNGHNSIVLKFTQDVLNHSTTDSDGNKYKGEDGKWPTSNQLEQGTENDEVVVWAHESYMIKPMKGVNSDKEPTFVVKNYTPVVGNPLPTVVEAHVVKDPLQEADYSNEYRFIGNYLGSTDEKSVVIPQYSYVYAKTGSDPTYKFRFYTGNKATWSPNKSIVQSHDRQGGYLDYKNFFGSDKSTLPQGAKQASIFGEEDFGETTGIDNVTIIAGSDVLTPIFTLDGKMVSVNGSVEGLAKGVYVKAGKKFVVK